MSASVAAFALAGLLLVLGLRPSPRSRLRASALLAPTSTRLSHSVVVTVALVLGFLLGIPAPIMVLGAAATVLGPPLLRRRQRQRAFMRRADESVETVFALAAELRAGRPPARALALVAASASELREPLRRASVAIDAGASAAAELRLVAGLPGCVGLMSAAAAWEVTEEAGGPVADVLDRLGEVLDADAQTRAALAAALAAPRATITLLAALPVLGVVLGESLGAHPLRLLLHRPLGWALLCAAVALDVTGVAWTRLLVRRALR